MTTGVSAVKSYGRSLTKSHARRVGITKQDIGDLILANFQAKRVGVYRDGTNLLPIVIRARPRRRAAFILSNGRTFKSIALR